MDLAKLYADLKKDFDTLKDLFFNHEHKGFDKTKPLPGSGSGGGVYGGHVAADGTALLMPDGWSVTKEATGQFLITHPLASSDISIVASSDNVIAPCYVHIVDDDSFRCLFVILAGSSADTAFFFHVIKP